MKSILEKLTLEEIKELSKHINQNQSKFFGNPLSLRKQEQLMANIFNMDNWDKLCLSKRKKNINKFDPKSEYQRTIISIEVLSEGFYNDPPSIEQIGYDINFGDCIGRIKEVNRESLTKQDAYDGLLDVGNDGSFFQIITNEQMELIEDIYSEVNRRLDDSDLSSALIDEQVNLIYSFYKDNKFFVDEISLDKEIIKMYLNK